MLILHPDMLRNQMPPKVVMLDFRYSLTGSCKKNLLTRNGRAAGCQDKHVCIYIEYIYLDPLQMLRPCSVWWCSPQPSVLLRHQTTRRLARTSWDINGYHKSPAFWHLLSVQSFWDTQRLACTRLTMHPVKSLSQISPSFRSGRPSISKIRPLKMFFLPFFSTVRSPWSKCSRVSAVSTQELHRSFPKKSHKQSESQIITVQIMSNHKQKHLKSVHLKSLLDGIVRDRMHQVTQSHTRLHLAWFQPKSPRQYAKLGKMYLFTPHLQVGFEMYILYIYIIILIVYDSIW